MNLQIVHENVYLDKLIAFQDHFLSNAHSYVYHSKEAFSQSLLKFQIEVVSEMSEAVNKMISQLTEQLVDGKRQYQSTLKDKFQMFLQSDYLPLLRINRYELTKLSLFGFDIYVEPLEAVLNILSRIDSIKRKILQSQFIIDDNETLEESLQKGWENYMFFANQWKISFNLYILKEYLVIGGKSFLRRDREILFTGISSLFNEFVPVCLQKKSMKLLSELASLNNSLYSFHPSYNYFHLYTLLLPLDNQYEVIFYQMKEIAQKCINNNLLTPFLFGILKNRQAFSNFIQQADHEKWLPYLNSLIAAIVINFKLRILEYEEIITLYEEAIQRAALIGQLRTEQILNDLEEGWRDAKEFFISAAKIGFSSGEVETWRQVGSVQIGQRIIKGLLDGWLLNLSIPLALEQYIMNPEQYLQNNIKHLTSNKIDLSFIKTTLYQYQGNINTTDKICSFIRIVNLLRYLKTCNEYVFYFIVVVFNKIEKEQFGRIVGKRLEEVADVINQFLLEVTFNNFMFIKQHLVTFHQNYPPTRQLQSILSFYLTNFDNKKSIITLLSIIQPQTPSFTNLALLIINKFIPKVSTKRIKIKTFEKQYIVHHDYINLPYETQSLVHVIVSEIMSASKTAQRLISILVRVCPWVSFGLLKFAINDGKQLISFYSWLIDNQPYHNLLYLILEYSGGKVMSDQGMDLIKQFVQPSILDVLVRKISELDKVDELHIYCKLILKLKIESKEKQALCKDLLANYLFLLQKESSQTGEISIIIQDIINLAPFAFQQNLNTWLTYLLLDQINAKTEINLRYRKKTTKNSASTIYFINEIDGQSPQEPQSTLHSIKNNQEASPLYHLQSQLSQPEPQPQINHARYLQTYEKINKLSESALSQLLHKESMIILQEIKYFNVPKISKQIIEALIIKGNSVYLNFIGLNAENYAHIVQLAIVHEQLDFLANSKMITAAIKFIPVILLIQQKNKCYILKKMSLNLSISDKIKISQHFYLQNSMLKSYCDHLDGIEYLCAFNNSNWRLIIDFFMKEFTNSKISSLLLQYNEFLMITNERNTEYEHQIDEYAKLFNKIVDVFNYKLDLIEHPQAYEEEILLRITNTISSLNLITYSLELKQVVVKLAILDKSLSSRGLKGDNSWIVGLNRLNDELNGCFKGQILLPDFIYSYNLTNSFILNDQKSQLGLILQKYYTLFDENATKSYVPLDIETLQLQQFITNPTYSTRINPTQDRNQIQGLYEEIVLKLVKQDVISIDQTYITVKSSSEHKEGLQFYRLGCCYAMLGTEAKYQPKGLLESILARKKLSWQQLKGLIQIQRYEEIKQIISTANLNKEIFFIEKEVELIPKGQHIKVNEYNKEIYCNKLALHLLGSDFLSHLRLFLSGFVNQNL